MPGCWNVTAPLALGWNGPQAPQEPNPVGRDSRQGRTLFCWESSTSPASYQLCDFDPLTEMPHIFEAEFLQLLNGDGLQ